VESLDVLPTVLDLLGLLDLRDSLDSRDLHDPSGGDVAVEFSVSFAGRSLVPAMRGKPLPPRAILVETEMSRFYIADSLSRGRWKLIADRSGALERSVDGNVRLRARGESRGPPAHYLFDLKADPAERWDVSGEHPEIAERLRGELDEMLRAAATRGRGVAKGATRNLSVEEREELRSLGYVESDSPL
jgi:hypothetical protein